MLSRKKNLFYKFIISILKNKISSVSWFDLHTSVTLEAKANLDDRRSTAKTKMHFGKIPKILILSKGFKNVKFKSDQMEIFFNISKNLFKYIKDCITLIVLKQLSFQRHIHIQHFQN